MYFRVIITNEKLGWFRSNDAIYAKTAGCFVNCIAKHTKVKVLALTLLFE